MSELKRDPVYAEFERLAKIEQAAREVLESACSVPPPYIGNANDPVNDLRLVSGRRIEALRLALGEKGKR